MERWAIALLMAVQLTGAILIFAAIVLGVMVFLRRVVRHDSVEYDLEFLWDFKVTCEQIDYPPQETNR